MQDHKSQKNNGCGCLRLIFLLIVIGIGYLMCSLISHSFDYHEWNETSNIIKWISIMICCFVFSFMIKDDE